MKSLSSYRAPCLAIIALTLLLTPTWGQKRQTDPKREVVGFVEDVKGDWFLDDKIIPSKGKSPVPAGSIQRAKSPRNAANRPNSNATIPIVDELTSEYKLFCASADKRLANHVSNRPGPSPAIARHRFHEQPLI